MSDTYKDEQVNRLFENVQSTLRCICGNTMQSIESAESIAHSAYMQGWRCPDALDDDEVFCSDCYRVWTKDANK